MLHHLFCSSSSSSSQTPFSLQTNKILLSNSWRLKSRRHMIQWRVLATEKEPPRFEVDQEKARQALNELDLQLESLSKRQIAPPKIRASSFSNMNVQMREEPPEITGPVLGYLAFILFLFSIFYNILFLTVIKPAVDASEDIVVVKANVPTADASTARQP